MGEKMTPCAECGMPCEAGEYHPYAACLMFKGCHNSTTVRANLTQPAQAVDVTFDMVREAEHFCPTDLPHLDKLRWKARKLTELLTAALPNANGKEGCQHEWEPVTERGKFCVRCGQIITNATFEYVPPQEDTPDAAR